MNLINEFNKLMFVDINFEFIFTNVIVMSAVKIMYYSI